MSQVTKKALAGAKNKIRRLEASIARTTKQCESSLTVLTEASAQIAEISAFIAQAEEGPEANNRRTPSVAKEPKKVVKKKKVADEPVAKAKKGSKEPEKAKKKKVR